MIFQMVLKGIAAIDRDDANHMLRAGILCQWWRRVTTLPRNEVPGRLTTSELYDHLNKYGETVPGEAYTYGQNSPFISTTAGTYQATSDKAYKHIPAEFTALKFATRNFRVDGAIFRAWLPVLGRPSLPLEPFAEEVRDVNQYSKAYGFHSQGEVVAKIVIPPSQIHSYVFVNGRAAGAALASGSVVVTDFAANPMYVEPSDFVNVRDEL